MPTQSNARALKPEILRNEIVQRTDQMASVTPSASSGFVSARTLFPTVNIDDPDEEYYSFDGFRGPMEATAFSAESPLGVLDLPEREDISVQSYKRKYRPDKGAETELSNVPFSLYQRAAAVLRSEIFLTRELLAWRGDDYVSGLTGKYGQTAHPDIPTGHVITPASAWSDSVNATPYEDVTSAGYEVMDNGRLFGDEGEPTLILTPSLLRDMKGTDDMEDRVSGVRIKALNTGTIQEIVDESVGNVVRCNVKLPRTNADGEFLDESGSVVENVKDAARDNVLEPYDPATATTTRNAVVMLPGAGSAMFPWFSERLLRRANNAPDPGAIAVDNTEGFFTQVWNEQDPIGPVFKAAQEVGFELPYPENFALIQGV